MPLFSVITPTWNRADGRLERCLDSVQAQRFRDFEHIIVDDGSTDVTEQVCAEYPVRTCSAVGAGVRYLKLAHGGRVIARNEGMRAAEGEWICHLDSDDAWDMMYLATFAYHIQREPEVNLWTCGAVVHGVEHQGDVHTVPVWTKLRPAWIPPLDETGRWIHAHYPSGLVGTGMFVFRKSCLEVTGYLPDWENHLDIADGVDGWLGYETGYSADLRWVGNPYGEDWCLHRALTMHFEARSVEAALYVHYVR